MHSLFSQVGFALLVGVCACGLAVGGWRERFAVVVVLAGAAASMALPLVSHGRLPAGPLAAVDACVLVGLVRACWGSRRLWPYITVALQGLAMALHALHGLQPRMDPWIFLTLLGLTSDGVLLAIGAGVWAAARERWRS
jgi:hypothetical protein